MKTPGEMAEEWCKAHYQQQASMGVKEGTEQAFLAGYKAAQQWISVYDKLPDFHEDVLAHTIHMSYREIKVIRYEPNYGFDFVGGVTHWMPLPAPPKEEE